MKKQAYQYVEWANEGPQIRLETFLKSKGISSNLFLNALHRDAIRVNGQERKRKQALLPGEKARLYFEDEAHNYEPIDLGLGLVYEDEDLMVVNKPENLVVHHSKALSLANHIAFLMEDRGLKRAVRFVNRLDRDTTGLVICALNPFAQAHLAHQMDQETMEKIYIAVLSKKPPRETDIIDLPLSQSTSDPRYLMDPQGKPSKTAYRLLFEQAGLYVCAVRLLTGRTHQIRAHFAAIGCPIYGDGLYGQAVDDKGQRLMAWKVAFDQPRRGNRIELKADFPEEMKLFLSQSDLVG